MGSNQRLLEHGSLPEDRRIADILRKETVGGGLLLVATVVALVWANSPLADSYTRLRDHQIGPEFFHLHLSLGTWAADGLLDIAFALAILAVIGTHLPIALRTFLLTLAVVDDLFAITIIAVFYTSDLALLPLLGALVPLGSFMYAVQRRVRSWWLLPTWRSPSKRRQTTRLRCRALWV